MASRMTEVLKQAQGKVLEAKLEKRAQRTAKDLNGHVHVLTSAAESVTMQVLGKEFQKSARRKLN